MAVERDQAISRGRFTVSQMMDLQQAEWAAMAASRKRIEDARDLLMGKVTTPIPAQVQAQGFSDLTFDGPEMVTVPLHLSNRIAARQSEPKRYPIGQGVQALSTATRLEQWSNAAISKTLSWDDAVDVVLNEGEAAAIVQVKNTQYGYGSMPDLYEHDAESEKEGGQEEEDAPSPERRYNAQYEQKRPDGSTDHLATARAYSSARIDYMARCFPIEVRLLSRLQCVPINPRTVGNDVQLDGLLVRTRYTRNKLIKNGWRWEGMRDSLQQPATDYDYRVSTVSNWSEARQSSTASGWSGFDQVTLYEAWLEDEDGPFAAFCVDGKPTTRVSSSGDEILVDGVLDLEQKWGIERLPICYSYGLRWYSPNPDARSIPFSQPLRGSWIGANTLRAAMTYHTWATAYLGWAYKPDPEVVRAMSEAGLALTMEVQPMKVIPVAGDLSPLVHPGPGREVLDLYGMHKEDAQREGPSAAAFGGGSADSAIGHSVQARDSLAALYHASEGSRRLFEQVGSTLLELGCALSEKFDTPLPIARNIETPVQQMGDTVSASRAPIILRAKDAGGVYDLHAIYAKQRGDDLAKRQQNVELVKSGLMTTRTFLEEDGDPAPEITWAELQAEELSKTPVIQARRLQLAASYAGDQEQADLMRAMASEQAAPNSTVQQPVPQGILQGVSGPPGMAQAMGQPGAPMPPGMGGPAGQQPGMPGVSMPAPASSQLGGIVSSGIQQGPLGQMAQMGLPTGGLGVGALPPPAGMT